jgi:hypothetical protein
VVFGSGRPFFATCALPEPLRLENPTTIVQCDRRENPRFRPKPLPWFATVAAGTPW